jgi:hypothetical protein
MESTPDNLKDLNPQRSSNSASNQNSKTFAVVIGGLTSSDAVEILSMLSAGRAEGQTALFISALKNGVRDATGKSPLDEKENSN